MQSVDCKICVVKKSGQILEGLWTKFESLKECVFSKNIFRIFGIESAILIKLLQDSF